MHPWVFCCTWPLKISFPHARFDLSVILTCIGCQCVFARAHVYVCVCVCVFAKRTDRSIDRLMSASLPPERLRERQARHTDMSACAWACVGHLHLCDDPIRIRISRRPPLARRLVPDTVVVAEAQQIKEVVALLVHREQRCSLAPLAPCLCGFLVCSGAQGAAAHELAQRSGLPGDCVLRTNGVLRG